MDQALSRGLREKLDASGKDCPEASLLAAFYDRALPPAEASRWETHFSACARCQEQLAVLARTEPALAEVRVAAEPSPFRRFWTARWLAPLATAAAALILWVAVRPAPPTVTAPTLSDATQPVLERQQPAAPDAKMAAKTAEADQFETDATRKKADANVGATQEKRAEGKLQDAAPAPKKPSQFDELQASGARDRAAPVAMESKAEETQAQVGSAQTSAQTTRAQVSTPASQPAGQPPAQKETEVTSAAQSPALGRMDPTARRDAALAQKTAEPDAAEKSREAEARRPRAGLAAPPRQEETVPADKSATNDLKRKQDASESPALRLEAGVFRGGPVLAVAPGGKVLWRVGSAGTIEKSSNAGKTWTPQVTPVTADLFAASAPSGKVCWVVGAAGTILRTVDGEKWEKVASPVETDLHSVSARDAANASVITADGKTYVTSDGGRTWQQK
jgi:hypothetical protein